MIVQILVVALTGLAKTAQGADSRLDPEVTKTLAEAGSVDIFASFEGKARSNQDIIASIDRQSFSSREEKATALIQELKKNMELTQKEAMTAFQNSQAARSKKFHQFWISNELYVEGADQATIDVLLGVDKVSQITKELVIPIEPSSTVNVSGLDDDVQQYPIQWGVKAVNATFIWEQGFEGQGIVVGVIDTGVNVNHEALRAGFRSRNGWYDPWKGTKSPTDSNGHGTHCTGTAVGRTKGIGVAPKAMWIACRGCPNGCPTNDLLKCGEWMACPSGGSCTGLPDIVSNSWGGGVRIQALMTMIDTWVSIEIHPVFAAGNSGPNCKTVGFPGQHRKVISVGNIDESLRVNSKSSRGPSREGRIQPAVAAPGTEIYSAGHDGVRSYRKLTGTSMACPHVAGLIALLLSNQKSMSVDEVHSAIVEATVPVRTQGTKTCGTTSNQVYPNNFVGNGLVSATKLKLKMPDPDPDPGSSPGPGSGFSSVDKMTLLLGRKTMMAFVMCVLYY